MHVSSYKCLPDPRGVSNGLDVLHAYSNRLDLLSGVPRGFRIALFPDTGSCLWLIEESPGRHRAKARAAVFDAAQGQNTVCLDLINEVFDPCAVGQMSPHRRVAYCMGVPTDALIVAQTCLSFWSPGGPVC
jgi:hypothetical protein